MSFEKDIKERFGIDITPHIKGYKIVKVIEGGVNQNIWVICASAKRCNIMKIQDNPSLEYEAYMQKVFKTKGIEAPEIIKEIHLKNGKTVSIVIMSMLDGCVVDLLKKPLSKEELDQIFGWIMDTFKKMCASGLIHGDFHWGNLCLKKDKRYKPLQYRPVMIDFGYSSEYEKCYLPLEILQALRTLAKADIDRGNRKYLEQKLYDLYVENIGYIDKSKKVYGKMYKRILKDYFYGFFEPKRQRFVNQ